MIETILAIILFLVVITIAILGFGFFSLNKIINQKIDNEKNNLVSSINLELISNLSRNKEEIKSEIVEKVIEKMSANSNLQIEQNADTKSKIDLKFHELQSSLHLSGQNVSQSQKNEFTEIKSLNQNSLLEMQKTIQDSLSKAIFDLSALVNQNFDILRRTNQEKLDQINIDVQNRLNTSFAQHQKSFEEVSKNVGQVQSLAQQMVESTSSIDKLNNVFSRTNSQSFGNFGEKYLESLLTQYLHSSMWQSQVKMSGSQEKIDFVITFDDQKIGIDSKFPVTKYQDYLHSPTETKQTYLKAFLAAILAMATDISTKYDKGEFGYLFMYLPSDGMYTTVVDNADLVQKLQKINVMPVSPITIFPILTGLRTYYSNKFINENAKDIMKGLDTIRKNMASFRDEYRLLGEKLRQAQQNYEKASDNLLSVEKTMIQLDNKAEKNNSQELQNSLIP